jgi:hypothetical protein
MLRAANGSGGLARLRNGCELLCAMAVVRGMVGSALPGPRVSSGRGHVRVQLLFVV